MASVSRYINVTARCANLRRSQALKSLGLCGNQHTYVLTVCRNPGISQERLAREIYVHKSNAARQVAALEAAGFIERRVNPLDKRELLLYPTPRAEAARPVIRQALAEWNDQLTEGFTPDEREQLERLMERVMQRARALIDAQCGEEGAP